MISGVRASSTRTLTATGVADSDGTVTSVAFYRDANDNDTLEVDTDELLGEGTDDGGGTWSLLVSGVAFPAGIQIYFAQATDNDMQAARSRMVARADRN